MPETSKPPPEITLSPFLLAHYPNKVQHKSKLLVEDFPEAYPLIDDENPSQEVVIMYCTTSGRFCRNGNAHFCPEIPPRYATSFIAHPPKYRSCKVCPSYKQPPSFE